jgi:hypothetical protein
MTDETVLMIDTIGKTSGNIPVNTPKVAGYNTGSNGVPWSTADWNRFSNAGKVIMCQDADYSTWHSADGGDVEPGAMTVAGFVKGATLRQQFEWNTVAYVDKANVAELVKACKAANLDKVELWIGDWELNQEQAASQLGQTVGGYQIVAIQWASPTSNPHTIVPGGTQTLREANLDLSVTLPAWFAAKADAVPVATPVATPVAPVAPVVTTPVSSTEATLIITDADGDDIMLTVKSDDGGKSWKLN